MPTMLGRRRSRSRIVPWFAVAACVGVLGFVVRSLLVGESIDLERGSVAQADRESGRDREEPDPRAGSRDELVSDHVEPDRDEVSFTATTNPERNAVEADLPARLCGRVVDTAGRPAANCAVSIRVARQLDSRWDYLEVARGETTADGAYELEVAPSIARSATIASLIAYRSPAEAGFDSIGAALRKGGETGRSLRLAPAGLGIVRVVDADGDPIEDAAVTPHGFPQLETSTDANGVATFTPIPSGERRFSALVPGRPIATSDSVQVSPDASFALDVVLSRGVSVKGRVVDRDDLPLPGATVRIDGALESVTTDASGAFAFDDVAAGKRKAVAVVGTLKAVKVDFEAPADDLLIRSYVGPVAAIECVDAEGRPLDPDELSVAEVARGKVLVTKAMQIRVRVESAGVIGAFAVGTDPLLRNLEAVATTDRSTDPSLPIVVGTQVKQVASVREKAGRFRIYAPMGADPYFIVAKHARHGIAVAGPLETGRTGAGTRLAFGSRGRLDVEVVDSRGGPLPAELSVSSREGAILLAQTGTDGRCSLSGLPFGEILVTASVQGAARSRATTILEPGQISTMRLELEVGTRLFGVLSDANGSAMSGATLWFFAENDHSDEYARAITDAAGAFFVDHAPRGATRITVVPDVSGIRFGAEMIQDHLEAPILLNVSGAAEQQADLAAPWPSPCRVVLEPRIAGARLDTGSFELRRTLDGRSRVEGPPEPFVSGRSGELVVAPGEYVVSFRGEGGAWFASTPLILNSGSAGTVVCGAPATGPLTGIVEDSTGSPLAGVSFYFQWAEAYRHALTGGRAIAPFCDVDLPAYRTLTGTDGSFAVPTGQSRGHVLVAIKKGFAPFFLPMDEELARRVPLRLRLQVGPATK